MDFGRFLIAPVLNPAFGFFFGLFAGVRKWSWALNYTLVVGSPCPASSNPVASSVNPSSPESAGEKFPLGSVLSATFPGATVPCVTSPA